MMVFDDNRVIVKKNCTFKNPETLPLPRSFFRFLYFALHNSSVQNNWVNLSGISHSLPFPFKDSDSQCYIYSRWSYKLPTQNISTSVDQSVKNRPSSLLLFHFLFLLLWYSNLIRSLSMTIDWSNQWTTTKKNYRLNKLIKFRLLPLCLKLIIIIIVISVNHNHHNYGNDFIKFSTTTETTTTETISSSFLNCKYLSSLRMYRINEIRKK